MKNFMDNKEFWKTMRSFSSDKNSIFLQISIEKNNLVISDKSDLSEELSTLFEDAGRSVNVKPDSYYLNDTENLNDPVEIAIRRFENHPSVQAIKQNISVNQDFYFANTEVRDILKETAALINKENGTFFNIPTKRLKEVSDICAPALNDIWSKETITQKRFSKKIKLADLTPVLKKEDVSLLKYYRAVSVLPLVSKIY